MDHLPKWKKNAIFEAVLAAGLGPEEFEWDDSGEDICLRHQTSQAYFVFGGMPGSYVTRYRSGDEPVTELPAYSWETSMTRVARWLGDVRRDTETPDLWAELRRQTELLAAAWDANSDNTPFTVDERDEIGRQLNELRELTKRTYALSEVQLVELNARLDYLVHAASRLGRKDWLLVFVGATVAFVLATALPPDVSRHILQTFVSAIDRWFGGDFPGLGSG